MTDRLYRSTDDRMIAGVAGGVAENLDADPSIIRIVWAVLIFLTGGIALLVYVVMAIVVPERPEGMTAWPAGDATATGGGAPAAGATTAAAPGTTEPVPDGGWRAPDGSTVPLAGAPAGLVGPAASTGP